MLYGNETIVNVRGDEYFMYTKTKDDDRFTIYELEFLEPRTYSYFNSGTYTVSSEKLVTTTPYALTWAEFSQYVVSSNVPSVQTGWRVDGNLLN